MKFFTLAANILLALCGTGAQAQTVAPLPVPPQPAAFEVASVRMADASHPNTPDGASPISTFPTNRFFAHKLDLKLVIQMAYGLDYRYIRGDPDWLGSQLYDIDAKVEGDRQLTFLEIRPLLQNLLQQRFHLAVHHETKMTSGFALVVAKNGPKLQPPKDQNRHYAQILPNRLDAWGMDAEHLAHLLSIPAGYPVVNKTGLTGSYDIHLNYAPPNDPNSSLPSIFTAVQEQLGLRLESQKIPVDYLIIDHVDKIPTEN